MAMAKLIELGELMDQLPFRERQHVARVLRIVAERASRKLPIDTRSRNEASITAHTHLAMVAYHSS
jgi:hypothetical protein